MRFRDPRWEKPVNDNRKNQRIKACVWGVSGKSSFGLSRGLGFKLALQTLQKRGVPLKLAWFKTRKYRHFDAPVSAPYADDVSDPQFVAKHSWLPLIHYVKRIKRYKKLENKTVLKDRSIMFASHRGACILSKYTFDLSRLLDQHYEQSGLENSVIAYRKLGRANYHFSADAYRFAKSRNRCVVLCFDITGFFDNLDHGILKNRLKQLLAVDELPANWYAVFRHVTKFSKVRTHGP